MAIIWPFQGTSDSKMQQKLMPARRSRSASRTRERSLGQPRAMAKVPGGRLPGEDSPAA